MRTLEKLGNKTILLYRKVTFYNRILYVQEETFDPICIVTYYINLVKTY